MTSAIAERADTIAGTEKGASALVLGLTGAAWDRVLVCSLIVAVVATVFVGLAVAGSVLTRRREAEAAERDLRQLRETVAAKVAEARSEGVAAGQAAANARGQAERESPSAGNLQLPKLVEREKPGRIPGRKDTAPAGAQTQNEDSRGAGLSPEKLAALTAALRSGPGNVSIDYDGADGKTQPLGTQLQHAFKDAGWNVSSGIMLGISEPPKSGILIRANQGSATPPQELTTRAFKTAGIPFDLRLDRRPKPYTSGQAHVPFGMGVDDVEIVVTAPRR